MKLKLWPSSSVMRFSVIAFIVCLILSILSMGFLGVGLFYVASGAIGLFFSDIPNNMNTWRGDWVWPAMIAIPMLWSFGFLIAGKAFLYFQQLDWTNLTLRTSYIVILLFLNLLLWLVLLLNVRPE